MNVYEAVTKRRSIRRFKDIAVPYDVLEKCVNAARLAPSARNYQLCEYVVVEDEKLLPMVFHSVTRWAGQPREKGAPPTGKSPRAYIIILINSKLEADLGAERKVTTYDVGLAAGSMILVATENGLGSCPILSFDPEELKGVLNIPDTHEFALGVALGYPDEKSVPEVYRGKIEYWVDSQGTRHVPKKKLENVLHRNKF